MGDSLCDMFLKEHEKYLPIHAVMQASASKPKTPYQLDLEVKNRKPSIVPKVGDMVKIKSWEWYGKWKDENEIVNVPESFIPPMAKFCGKVLTVEESQPGYFIMKDDEHKWSFSLEMFEEVYPVQEQLSSKFPKIDLSGAIQPLPNCLGGELVLSKEEQERLKQQLREKWDVKPKLKQIKTTHLIKLKKL